MVVALGTVLRFMSYSFAQDSCAETDRSLDDPIAAYGRHPINLLL